MIKTKLLIVLLVAVAMGCKNQPEGLAPSSPTGIIPPDSKVFATQMKYGETQQAGGWEISLDTSDSVETIELANGWTVEVVHE